MTRARYSPFKNPREHAPEDVGNEPTPASFFDRDALEVRLSKGDAANYARKGWMNAFTLALSEWAERMATKGYTIEAVPEEGPGTMRWRATR